MIMMFKVFLKNSDSLLPTVAGLLGYKSKDKGKTWSFTSLSSVLV